MTSNIHGSQSSHTIANKIQSDMRRQNAYIDVPERNTIMQPVTYPPPMLSKAEIQDLHKCGQDIYDASHYLNLSYLKSINRPNFSVSPFSLYFEQRILPSLIPLMRDIAKYRPPTPFYRIDMTRPMFFVENQTRIAGLGLTIGVQKSFEQDFNPNYPNISQIGTSGALVNMLAQHILQIKTNGVVLIITSSEYLQSDKILAHELSCNFGFIVVLLTLDQLYVLDGNCIDMDRLPANQMIRPQGEGTPSGWYPIRFILRRAFNLHTIVMIKNYEVLMKAYLDNHIGIFPEMNLLEDSKLGLACMSLHATKNDFPSHLHNLYPKAGLFPRSMDEPFYYGDALLTLNQIVAMPQRQRKFVLKYAGDDLSYGCFGGRAVYRLFRISANQVRHLFNMALEQTHRGHPWMLQEADMTYYESEYLDKTTNKLAFHNRLYARNMIFYNKDAQGDVQLIAGMINLRTMWKVSGADDAIIAPLYTAPNIDVRYEPKGTHYIRRVVTFHD